MPKVIIGHFILGTHANILNFVILPVVLAKIRDTTRKERKGDNSLTTDYTYATRQIVEETTS